MRRSNAIVYLSGRIVALVVLLGFQVVLVRAIPPEEYALYAMVFAIATLMQTAVALGIPRVIPKYVSQAGWRLPFATIRRLIVYLLSLRVTGSSVLMAATFVIASAAGLSQSLDPWLVAVAALFIIASLVQNDADAMAQALGLQKTSRNCTIGESVLRLALVAWQDHAGLIHTATSVLEISLLTSVLASTGLLVAIFRRLSRSDEIAAPEALDWRELRQVALSGYASSMAWFTSSPAVIRLIASRMLAVVTFAGFAFAQSLVLSFQRYTPGTLIFPFIEPAVMRNHAKTGDIGQLERALSLIIKIDIIFIGAAIVGSAIAGRTIVEAMTDGHYGAEAYALPLLLVYIVTSSIYRSFEIVAIALNARSALLRTFLLSLVWLAITIALTPVLGVAALLLCPIGDALSRLAIVYHGLHKVGVRHVVDWPVLGLVVGLIVVFVGVGLEASQALALDGSQTVMTGVGCSLVYLAAIAISRPLRKSEAELAVGQSRNPLSKLFLATARR